MVYFLKEFGTIDQDDAHLYDIKIKGNKQCNNCGYFINLKSPRRGEVKGFKCKTSNVCFCENCYAHNKSKILKKSSVPTFNYTPKSLRLTATALGVPRNLFPHLPDIKLSVCIGLTNLSACVRGYLLRKKIRYTYIQLYSITRMQAVVRGGLSRIRMNLYDSMRDLHLNSICAGCGPLWSAAGPKCLECSSKHKLLFEFYKNNIE